MTAPAAGAGPKIVFILGTQRSGSTLLARLLDGLPEVRTLGEVSNTWTALARSSICSCGQVCHFCPVWRPVAAALTAGAAGRPIAELAERAQGLRANADLLGRGRWRPAGPASTAPIVQQWRTLYREFANVTGAEVVVDSSKSPTALLNALATGLPVTVVHLTRDPRAVFYSSTRRVRGGPVLGVFRSAMSWCLTHWLAEHHPAVPPHVHLRYEDLLAAPHEELGALARGLDLPPAWRIAETEDGYELRQPPGDPSHDLAGNVAMRQRRGTIALRRDDEWRERLPRPSRWAMTVLTRPVRRRFGY